MTRTRIFIGALVTVAAFSAGVSAQGGRSSCADVVRQTLGAAGVASSDVSDIAYVKERGAGDDGQVEGYMAWVRLKSCSSGYVVIDLSRHCDLNHSYTDGACRVDGITPG